MCQCRQASGGAPAPNEEVHEAMVKEGEKGLKELIKEALSEMGVVGDPRMLQVKCQKIDCEFNFSHWCQKGDGKVALDEEGLCRSYSKF